MSNRLLFLSLNALRSHLITHISYLTPHSSLLLISFAASIIARNPSTGI